MGLAEQLFSPQAIQPYNIQRDEHWRERRAIYDCLECAGIWGERAADIEYRTLKKLGIVKPLPCEQTREPIDILHAESMRDIFGGKQLD